MNLDIALKLHGKWKNKFRVAIQAHEEIDAESISRNDRCEFGKWLHTEGKAQLGLLKSYNDCVAAHTCFHRVAGKVAVMINSMQYEEAARMLENNASYAIASALLTSTIYRLKCEAKEKCSEDILQGLFHVNFLDQTLVDCC